MPSYKGGVGNMKNLWQYYLDNWIFIWVDAAVTLSIIYFIIPKLEVFFY